MGGVLITADADGALHLFMERQRGHGGPLTLVGTAPLSSGWPEAGDCFYGGTAERPVTASCIVTKEGVPYVLLVGFEDGTLGQVPLPGGATPPASSGEADDGYGRVTKRSSAPHTARVTDLLPLRNGTSDRMSVEHSCFASASASGEVRVWALRDMSLLRAFHQHTGCVHTLMQPPPGVPLHMESWFLAISSDGTISVYDATPLLPPPLAGGASAREEHGPANTNVSLVTLLSGHAEPVRELIWRPAECMLCVRCSLRPAGAARTEAAPPQSATAKPCTPGQPTAAASAASIASAVGASGPTQAMAAVPGGAGGVGVDWDSSVYVWQLPAGRIARVLYGAEARPHLAAMRTSPLCQQVPDTTGLREYRMQSHHASAAKRLVESLQVSLGEGNPPLQVLIFNIKRLAAEAQKAARARESLYQSQASPRGRRSSFGVGITADTPDASTSIPGKDAASASERTDAAPSHRRSASGGTRSPLTAGSVPPDVAACQSALSFMCCWGVDGAFDRQCREEIGLHPPPPCVTYGVRGHGGNFSFLTPRAQVRHHRWQCSSHLTALHSIAAVALANTLMMSPGYDDVRNVCSSLVTHFSIVLPERLGSFCSPSLSLLARHYVDGVEEVQQAARALMEGTIHRMRADVRSQIMAAWAPRIVRLAKTGSSTATTDLTSPQGVCVLVLAVLASRFNTPIDPAVCALLVHQLLTLLEHPADLHRSAAAELIGKGYAVWKAHVIDAPGLIKILFQLSAAHMRNASDSAAAGNGAASPEAPGGGGGGGGGGGESGEPLPSLNRFQAALLAVGAAEPRHFCRAMGAHAVHMGGTTAARIAAVSAMISLVKSRGTSLEADLPVVVHAVLKPLDPSVPMLREGCLRASTTAIRELVKRYPMMAFHQATQRLAVGTVEGVVLIYDLKTATKWRILNGHERAVTAVAFSKSGEHLASIAPEEQAIRFWLAGSQGLFSFLGLQGSCLHTTTLDPPIPLEDHAIYELEWTTDAAVKLSCNKHVVGTFSRPV